MIIKGRARLRCFSNGILKWDTGWIDNAITNTGLSALAGLAGDVGSVSPFKYLAVGTNSVEPNATQTELGSEITSGGLERAEGLVSRVTTYVTNDTLQVEHTWTATADHTVREIGIFNDSTNGIMLGRRTENKNVDNMEDLNGQYQIIFTEPIGS